MGMERGDSRTGCPPGRTRTERMLLLHLLPLGGRCLQRLEWSFLTQQGFVQFFLEFQAPRAPERRERFLGPSEFGLLLFESDVSPLVDRRADLRVLVEGELRKSEPLLERPALDDRKLPAGLPPEVLQELPRGIADLLAPV